MQSLIPILGTQRKMILFEFQDSLVNIVHSRWARTTLGDPNTKTKRMQDKLQKHTTISWSWKHFFTKRCIWTATIVYWQLSKTAEKSNIHRLVNWHSVAQLHKTILLSKAKRPTLGTCNNTGFFSKHYISQETPLKENAVWLHWYEISVTAKCYRAGSKGMEMIANRNKGNVEVIRNV